MAKVELDMPDDLFSGIIDEIEDVQEKMLMAAAPLYKAAAEKKIRATIRHKDKSTEELVRSIQTTEVITKKNGGKMIKLVFKGTDKKGTRNAIKAFEMEYGNSRQPATPWIDSLNSSVKNEVSNAMQQVMEREVQK